MKRFATRHGTGKVNLIAEKPGEPAGHVVRPEDIDASPGEFSTGAVGSFGKHEVEAAAGNLVRFFQMRDGWVKFSIPELVEFAKLDGFDPKRVLFGLTGPWEDSGGLGSIKEAPPYVIALSDGSYCITDLFIDRCKSSIKKERLDTA